MMTRIVDILALVTLFGALTLAYKPKFKPWPTVGGVLLCLAGAQGQILLEEEIQTLHFLLYILAFILWGFVYARFFVQGLFREKSIMVIVYVASFFFFSDLSFVLHNLLLPIADINWRVFRILGIFICGWYLYRHAIHTTRNVPVLHWVSIIAVTALYLAVYYAMHHTARAELQNLNAIVSLLLLIGMLITFFLCSSLIHHYESGIFQVAKAQSSEAEKGMVRESMRLNREMRQYQHEMNNHLAALRAVLDQGDVHAASLLLDEMQSSAPSAGNSIHSGNPIADAVLSQKAAEAEQKKIPMHIDACLDANLPLKDTELTSLLSNLLNNAIEASQHVASPKIDVHIYPTRAYLCISIGNKADISSLSGNPLLITTKKDPDLHGFGLSVVREIADRYHGNADFRIDKETETFIAQVSLLVNP